MNSILQCYCRQNKRTCLHFFIWNKQTPPLVQEQTVGKNHFLNNRWIGGRVVSYFDFGSGGPGFKSWSYRKYF